MVPAAGLFSRKSRIRHELHRRSDPTSARAIQEESAGQNHRRVSMDPSHTRRTSSPDALGSSFSSMSAPVSPRRSSFANEERLSTDGRLARAAASSRGLDIHDATATIDPQSVSSGTYKGLDSHAEAATAAPPGYPATVSEEAGHGGMQAQGSHLPPDGTYASRGVQGAEPAYTAHADGMEAARTTLHAPDPMRAPTSKHLGRRSHGAAEFPRPSGLGSNGRFGRVSQDVNGSAPARTASHAPDPMRAPDSRQHAGDWPAPSASESEPSPPPTSAAHHTSAAQSSSPAYQAPGTSFETAASGQSTAPALRHGGPSGNPFGNSMPPHSMPPLAELGDASFEQSGMQVSNGMGPAGFNPTFAGQEPVFSAGSPAAAHILPSSTAPAQMQNGILRAGPLFPS